MAVNPKLIIDALMKLFGGAKKQADEAVPAPRSFDPLSEPLSADAYQELPGYSVGRDILDTNRDLRDRAMSQLDPGPLEDTIPSGRVQSLNPERLPDTATKRAQRDDPDFHAARREQQIEDAIAPERRNFGDRSFDDTEGAARRGEVEEYADFGYGITNDPAGQAFDDFVNSSISKGQIDEVLLRQLELADPELVPVALERIQKFLGSRAGRQTITPESSPINSNTILDDDIPF